MNLKRPKEILQSQAAEHVRILIEIGRIIEIDETEFDRADAQPKSQEC
jgi:hypothetical protein